MRRQSAAVIGMVAAVLTAGIAPSASAQVGPNQYITTEGDVRCVVSADRIACERMGVEGFAGAPASQPGRPAPAASTDTNGTFSWDDAGIGASTGEVLALGGGLYQFHGWILMLAPDGTRMTNKLTYHGMLVSNDGTTVTPY